MSDGWSRKVPDSVGWWLRVGLRGHPTDTYYVNDLSGELRTHWGNNEGSKMVSVTYHKLKGWWWMKIPDIPDGPVLENPPIFREK